MNVVFHPADEEGRTIKLFGNATEKGMQRIAHGPRDVAKEAIEIALEDFGADGGKVVDFSRLDQWPKADLAFMADPKRTPFFPNTEPFTFGLQAAQEVAVRIRQVGMIVRSAEHRLHSQRPRPAP